MPFEEKTSNVDLIKPLLPIALGHLDQDLVLSASYPQKNDAHKIYLEKFDDYELQPMKDLPLDKKPLKGKIYLEKKANAVEYCLLSPKGEVVSGSFGPGELLIAQDSVDVVTEPGDLPLSNLELKKAILEKTFERRQTQRKNSLNYTILKPQRYELVSVPSWKMEEHLKTIQHNQYILSDGGGIFYYDLKNKQLIELVRRSYKGIWMSFPSSPRVASLKDLEAIGEAVINQPPIEYTLIQDAINLRMGQAPLTEETLTYYQLELYDELSERGHLSQYDSHMRFVVSFNADIGRLNHLIQEYNHTNPQNKAGKIARLQMLYQEIKHIDVKYSDIQRSYHIKEYQQLSTTLFNDIKKQSSLLGLASLDTLERVQPRHDFQDKKFLSSIIRNMSNGKAEALITILVEAKKSQHKGLKKLYKKDKFKLDKNALKHLYKKGEPGYEEYQEFLKHYTIKFLGGKNSKSFIVKSKQGLCILKIGNRMSNPGSAEEHLRARSLRDILIPVYAERLIMTHINGERVERNLQVSDFMAAGDIKSFSEEQHRLVKASSNPESQTHFFEQAIDIYRQMGTILLGVQQDECAFPDMKNTNWLVDEQGRLRLADAKSFVFTKNGNLDPTLHKKRWSIIVYTPALTTVYNTRVYSADALHTYMLGKNLYQYLVKPDIDAFADMEHADDFDFSAPLFKTAIGAQLQDLIKNTTQADPTKRIPLQTAVAKLQELQMLPQKNKCRALLHECIGKIGQANRNLLFLDLIAFWSETITKVDSSQNFEAMNKEFKSIEFALTGLCKEIEDNLSLLDELQELVSWDKRLETVLSQSMNAIKAVKTPEQLKEINLNLRDTLEKALSPLQYECITLLKQIKADAFKNDGHMNAFYLKKGQEIMQADPQQLKRLKQELTEIRNDPTTLAIKNLIHSLVKNTSKADAISTAMSSIPVEQRKNVLQDPSQKSVEVRRLIKDSGVKTLSIFHSRAEQPLRHPSYTPMFR